MDDELLIHHYGCDRISYRNVRVQRVKITLSPIRMRQWITHARRTLARPVFVRIQWIQIAIQWWKHAMPTWIQPPSVAAVQAVRHTHFTTMVSPHSIAIKCCQIHIFSIAINIFGPLNVHRWQIINSKSVNHWKVYALRISMDLSHRMKWNSCLVAYRN